MFDLEEAFLALQDKITNEVMINTAELIQAHIADPEMWLLIEDEADVELAQELARVIFGKQAPS